MSGSDSADVIVVVGGGGYHGYNALEGTFLGGCIFRDAMRGGLRRLPEASAHKPVRTCRF